MLDPDLTGSLNHGSHGIHPGFMAKQPGPFTLLGPSSVAVHDNSNMVRNQINLRLNLLHE